MNLRILAFGSLLLLLAHCGEAKAPSIPTEDAAWALLNSQLGAYQAQVERSRLADELWPFARTEAAAGEFLRQRDAARIADSETSASVESLWPTADCKSLMHQAFLKADAYATEQIYDARMQLASTEFVAKEEGGLRDAALRSDEMRPESAENESAAKMYARLNSRIQFRNWYAIPKNARRFADAAAALPAPPK